MMRKNLEILAPAALLYVWGITVYALYGSGALPDRIPTHFNAAGQPDGWGTPAMLWLLPVVATAIYLLMTLVSRYPGAFNFPVRVTPGNRAQLEGITLDMIAWLKTELLCLFAGIQHQIVQFARRGHGTLSPLFVPAFLVVVFGTVAWHITAMRRVSRG